MPWPPFRHPDFCWPVARRAIGEEILELTLGLTTCLATRGHSLLSADSYPNVRAYSAATYRLRKQGLIVQRRGKDGRHTYDLSVEGRKRLDVIHTPDRMWKKKWHGTWYVLVYDVPETERTYRAGLRRFLQRMRMGCLQGSVWVAPHDIRPAYHDMTMAAGLGEYAFLFEARTVLGQHPTDVVHGAWDMDSLESIQNWYCQTCSDNTKALRKAKRVSAGRLEELARGELEAYHAAFEQDPLLPRALWPADYLGPKVYALHRSFQREIRRRFRSMLSGQR